MASDDCLRKRGRWCGKWRARDQDTKALYVVKVNKANRSRGTYKDCCILTCSVARPKEFCLQRDLTNEAHQYADESNEHESPAAKPLDVKCTEDVAWES
jgi:hypothetical protein